MSDEEAWDFLFDQYGIPEEKRNLYREELNKKKSKFEGQDWIEIKMKPIQARLAQAFLMEAEERLREKLRKMKENVPDFNRRHAFISLIEARNIASRIHHQLKDAIIKREEEK